MHFIDPRETRFELDVNTPFNPVKFAALSKARIVPYVEIRLAQASDRIVKRSVEIETHSNRGCVTESIISGMMYLKTKLRRLFVAESRTFVQIRFALV